MLPDEVVNIIKEDKRILIILFILIITIFLLSGNKLNLSQTIYGKVKHIIDKRTTSGDKYIILTVENLKDNKDQEIYCFGKKYKTCDDLKYRQKYTFVTKSSNGLLKLSQIK